MATHYTPIPTGTGVANTAALFNSRLQELDDAIVAIETGANSVTQLKFAAPTTLTLSANVAGSITATQSRHFVDTLAAAAAGELATIVGGADGDVMILQSVNAGRVITIKQTGNIYSLNLTDIVLDDPKEAVAMVYDATSGKWLAHSYTFTAFRESLATAATALTKLEVPDRILVTGASGSQKRLAVTPSAEVSSKWGVRSSAATIVADNVALPTIANAPTADIADDFPATSFPTTAAAGNLGGFVTTTFNLVRRVHNPVLYAIVRTPAAIGSVRYWIGLVSADVTAVDTLAGATEFAGFRYSTAVPDTTWKAITKDATTQNAGVNVGPVVANSTAYTLRMRVDSANGIIYFSVNNSAEVSISANLPAASTNLGLVCRPIAIAAAIVTLSVSRVYVEGK